MGAGLCQRQTDPASPWNNEVGMPEPKRTIAPKPSPRAVMRSLPPEVRLAMVEMPRDHRSQVALQTSGGLVEIRNRTFIRFSLLLPIAWLRATLET